jgi:hypothetical protein
MYAKWSTLTKEACMCISKNQSVEKEYISKWSYSKYPHIILKTNSMLESLRDLTICIILWLIHDFDELNAFE